MKAQLKLSDVPSWGEVETLLERMKTDYAEIGPRDFLIIALLSTTGIRTSELLALKPESFKLTEGVMLIRQLKREGEFYREVLLMPWIIPLIQGYVKHFSPGQCVFPITRRMVLSIVHRYTQKYLGRPVRSHAFRHAFATRILEKTRDLELCRRLLGHVSATTTQVYLNFTVKDRAEDIFNAIGGWK